MKREPAHGGRVDYGYVEFLKIICSVIQFAEIFFNREKFRVVIERDPESGSEDVKITYDAE